MEFGGERCDLIWFDSCVVFTILILIAHISFAPNDILFISAIAHDVFFWGFKINRIKNHIHFRNLIGILFEHCFLFGGGQLRQLQLILFVDILCSLIFWFYYKLWRVIRILRIFWYRFFFDFYYWSVSFDSFIETIISVILITFFIIYIWIFINNVTSTPIETIAKWTFVDHIAICISSFIISINVLVHCCLNF